jgi:hypothetical protein
MVDCIKYAEYLRSRKVPERAVRIAAFRDEERLILPVEAHISAAYGPVPEKVSITIAS